jgi:hypothetical protein
VFKEPKSNVPGEIVNVPGGDAVTVTDALNVSETTVESGAVPVAVAAWLKFAVRFVAVHV